MAAAITVMLPARGYGKSMEQKRMLLMTIKKRAVLTALRGAVEYCGYDFDELFANTTRRRIYVDLRSIVWSIYSAEMLYSPSQVALDFGWNRCTISCSIERADSLRSVDKVFADIYDSIHGAYMNILAENESKTTNTTSNVQS